MENLNLRALFQKRPQVPPASVDDLLDRIQGVERGMRRVETELKDLREELGKRVGRLWAAIKTLRNDEQTEDDPQEPPNGGDPPSGYRPRNIRRW